MKRRIVAGLAAALALCLCLGQGVTAAAAVTETPVRGSFTVSVRVREGELLAEEAPAYRFRLERIGWEDGRVLRTWYRTVRPEEDRLYPVDRDGYAQMKTVFAGLPEGRYRLVELGGRSYDFARAGSLSRTALADGTAVRFSIGPGEQLHGSAAFTSVPQTPARAVRFSL